LSNDLLPPRAASFAVMDYKVPVRSFSKQAIRERCKPILPIYVGHIGQKHVYDADGPLEAMDDILIRTERGVYEVTTDESGKLIGYPF
jgi:hypothetical protein